MKVLVTLLLLLFPMVFVAQQNTILPHPVVFKSMPGYIELDRSLSMDFSSLSSTIIQQLKTTGAYYHNLQLIDRTNKPLVIFKKLVNVPLDSYSINVNKQIIISYSSPKACYFAFHSLMQLIKSDDNGHLIINNCFVDDYPKYQWRGMHLDVARHFFQLDEIKQFLDVMATYKFTTFHWHLTDDQGWRIEN
jgi:hexosaminidase